MKVIDSNRYYLPGTNNRFLHLATVHYGIREFMCFGDKQTNKVYIEELTGGHLSFIKDDKLAEELHNFLVFNKLLDINRPFLPDSQWNNLGKR